MRFNDDVMDKNWYNGKQKIMWLKITAKRLQSIRRNAFNNSAFEELELLGLDVKSGKLKIHDGALNGLDSLHSIVCESQSIQSLPAGLFNPIIPTAACIIFDPWPENINLDEMFAKNLYRAMRVLVIENVRMPQTKFHYLAASNFTSMRHLTHLQLVNCGVEVIAPHAFDDIGHTLNRIILLQNWIKTISVDTFRIVFETKARALVLFGQERDHLLCTCELVEVDVMHEPLTSSGVEVLLRFACKASRQFTIAACNVLQMIDIAKLCIKCDSSQQVRTIDVEMTYYEGDVFIHTQFSGKLRVILTKIDATFSQVCSERVANANHRCLNLDRSIGQLNLNEIKASGEEELISITAIPILVEFGARPMHMMTVRRKIVTENWLLDILLALISLSMGGVLGLSFGIGITVARMPPEKTGSARSEYTGSSRSSTVYVEPVFTAEDQTDDGLYERIVETPDDGNYVEIEDAGYVAVL